MKKKFIMMTMVLSLALTACGANATSTDNTESGQAESGVSSDVVDSENDTNEDVVDDSEEIDYDALAQEIVAKVNAIPKQGVSLKEELEQVATLEAMYSDISAETQVEMTAVASLGAQVWDAELNSLWRRISNEFEESKKEEVLAEQRKWNGIKETAASGMTIMYEGGSIQPQIYNMELAEILKNRCYILASIYGESKGETVAIPTRSEYGAYVDNQDTNDVYSALYIYEGMESGSVGVEIEIYRLSSWMGYAEKNGDGYDFVSDDDTLKGTITYGNDGATFTVTESTNDLVSAGETFEFPWAL